MSQANTKALNKFIELARYIAANADEQLTLAMLAARVHLSPSRFQRVFKSIFGVSPKKFQQAARSDRFKTLLRDAYLQLDLNDASHRQVLTGLGARSFLPAGARIFQPLQQIAANLELLGAE